jgi:hypothetical protein
MYRRFLESDYPEALELAEEALRTNPTDAIAMAIYAECLRNLRDTPRAAFVTDRDTVPAPPNTDLELPIYFDEDNAPNPPTLPRTDAARPPTPPGRPGGREMYRRFLESDYPRALALAEAALAHEPHDEMARAIARESRAALDLRKSIPVLKSAFGPERTMPLGAREALMLSHVNGVSTVGEIADASGLPPIEALHLIEEFVAAGILELRG